MEPFADEDSELGKMAKQSGLKYTAISELDDVTSNDGVWKAINAASACGVLYVVTPSLRSG